MNISTTTRQYQLIIKISLKNVSPSIKTFSYSVTFEPSSYSNVEREKEEEITSKTFFF